jgi:hypothetical protein
MDSNNNLSNKMLRVGDLVCECKFCGGDVTVEDGEYEDGLFIRCRRCGSEYHYLKGGNGASWLEDIDYKEIPFKTAYNIHQCMTKAFVADEKYQGDMESSLTRIYGIYRQYGARDDSKALAKCLVQD